MLNRWLAKRAASSVPAPISVQPSQKFNGNDGPWSSFPIQVGTPPQIVNVLVSTASSQTWAINPQGCTSSDPANCSISRGGFFQPNDSSTWKQNQDAANGLFPLVLETDLNVTGTGLYGYDTVSLSGQGSGGPTLDQQVVASIATKGYYLGLLGLNPGSSTLPGTSNEIPSFLSNLNQSNLIPSLSWSYTAGNQYRPGPVYGSLILGGYDSSRFEPNDVSFAFNNTASKDLVVHIGEIDLTTNDFITTLSTDNESIAAFIDSTTPYIILPLNICEQFEQAFGIEWDDGVQAYLVNDTLHSALQQGNTSVVFNIVDSSTVSGQGFNISLPYAAFDLVAGPPLLKNSSRYFPLMRASNDSEITLGRTFLQEAYVIADYEHDNFSVSQCSWESGASPHIIPIKSPSAPDDTNHTPSNKLSSGAIAGIVIGAVVALLVLGLLGFIFWRKRGTKETKHTQETKNSPVEIDSGMKDPYLVSPGGMHKDHPQSPELDVVEHKGHELDGQTYFDQVSPTNEHPVELPATERQSRTLSSPISLMSEMSDSTRLHRREPSDPTSVMRARSDATRMHRREPSDPVSPTRQRSDATRLHKRELSDPVSLLSERRESGVGNL